MNWTSSKLVQIQLNAYKASRDFHYIPLTNFLSEKQNLSLLKVMKQTTLILWSKKESCPY
jgi:hypothetical protein